MEKEQKIDTKEQVRQWLNEAKKRQDPEQDKRLALKELAPTDLSW